MRWSLVFLGTLSLVSAQECGPAAGACAYGGCCSAWGWCGATDLHCEPVNGCQAGYGLCNSAATPTDAPTPDVSTMPSPSPAAATDCGPSGGGASCSAGSCCSQWGWCGSSTEFCDAGCQVGYGLCNGQSPSSTPAPSNTPNGQGFVGVPATTCGNGVCENPWLPTGETCGTCPVDCGPCQLRDDVKTCVESNVVAMTFDDGPTKTVSTNLLTTLTNKGVTGSFFLIGVNMDAGNSAIVQSELAKGHSLLSHTYTHPSLVGLDFDQIYQEMSKTEASFVSSGVCKRPTLFRPPYGYIDDHVKQVTANMGYRGVVWAVDTNDWKNAATDPAIVVYDFVNQLYIQQPVGIISLSHDTQAAYTAVVPQLIDGTRAAGYSFVTVERCLWGPSYKNHPSYVHMNRLCSASQAGWATPAAGTCPVSDWSEWSQCDANCGSGTQTRVRYTITPGLEKTRAACAGVQLIQQQPCTSPTACSGTCSFSAWTNFGTCSKSCAGGTQMQTRELLAGNAATCGPQVHVQLCNTQACPGLARRALRGSSVDENEDI